MAYNFKHHVRDGLLWIGLFRFAGQLFIWANTLIIARFLTPADYGLVGMASLITGFILLIGNFGFGSSLIQRKNLQQIHIHSLFWLTVAIGLFFLVLINASSHFIADFFESTDLIPILQLSSLALFFNIIADIPTSLLLKNLHYKLTGSIGFISSLISSISVLCLSIKGFGAYSLIAGTIIFGVLKFFMACLLGKWAPKICFNTKDLLSFCKFGGTIVTDRLLWYLYTNADFMILAKRLSKYSFGLYSFAFELACVPTNKLQPIIHPVLFSSFSQIQDDLPQIRLQFLKIIQFSSIFYVIIYSLMFWASSDFVKIFLGPKWEPIIPVLQILVLIQPLKSISSLSPAVLHAIGRPEIGALNNLILVCVMIPCFYIGSFWGMIGVAISWCLAYPLVFIITTSRILNVIEIKFTSYLYQLYPGFRLIAAIALTNAILCIGLDRLDIPNTHISLWIHFLCISLSTIISSITVLWTCNSDIFFKFISLIRSKLNKS